MATTLTLRHERVDDIPVIIGLANQRQLGLNNGQLTVGWLAYILSQGDHRQSTVREWANSLPHTLERLLGQPLREVEFSDDRLSGILRRLSDEEAWEAIEEDLWAATMVVYELELTGIRLDSTTSYGYHQVTEEGVMPFGPSKDHRLYAGDCKMAALPTRAELVAHGDSDLVPLPRTGETAAQFESWVSAIVDSTQEATLVWDRGQLLGAGYEFERALSATVDGQPVHWTERVQVVRSRALAQRQEATLERQLRAAEAELQALTPAPGRGKRQIREEATLQAAIAQVLARHEVGGLSMASPVCSGMRWPWPPGGTGWAGGLRSPMPPPTGCRCLRPWCTIGGAGRWNGTFISSKTSRWA